MLKVLVASIALAGLSAAPEKAAAADDAVGGSIRSSEFPFWTAERLLVAAHGGPDEDGDDFSIDAYEKRGGRINVRSRRYKTRRRLEERRFGVAIQPGYAFIEGDVVKQSFTDGFSFTARFIAQISPIAQAYVDLGYSRHDMKDPRAMFFRTAVTSSSTHEGSLQVFSPAAYYSVIIPVGAGFHSKSIVNPKVYVGMGPMFTFADGRVNEAGSKGTVKGNGQQPFIQFTPGIGADVRVMEHYFIGLDLRYRLTLPTQRASRTKEFSVPKLYVFEPVLNFAWMFY